ncbi:SAM-dependent methyltransferase [Streptomyces albus subsp. chlorinus]|uniref:SAM-dependent methyltransferase n=1 Tax=Streptomyces albus TaxID=1888 RepID=UPI0015702184|nr:SAM-dependent methyltransferase [Streptomyces albus]NSC24689.1 SAM-dependent methyltransferase [Streptomyces albus subsp. chlorinus]
MSQQVPAGVGTRPHTARLYDFYLGGKTNYGPDRHVAVEGLKVFPNAMIAARQNRAFMHRAVRYLAREAGIRQFLDIGTGIPTAPNLHQVAQEEEPTARVVYSDNDPIVLAHARALMTSTPQGATDYVEADVRRPEVILERARETLDFSRPIGLTVIALFHFIADEDDPLGIVRHLLDALPSGSALALSHATEDFDPEGMRQIAERYRQANMHVRLRGHKEVLRFFDGVDLVEPGLAATCDWRLDLDTDDVPQLPGMVTPAEAGVWAGLGIKP